MFMAVTPNRKIAGGEASIADAAQAIARASSWRQRSTPQRMLDDQAFRSLFQASSGRPRWPRQRTPSIGPHPRGARKRLIPVVDLNDGRRQNRGEEPRQKEEDHRHRQNRRQRRGFFLGQRHSVVPAFLAENPKRGAERRAIFLRLREDRDERGEWIPTRSSSPDSRTRSAVRPD